MEDLEICIYDRVTLSNQKQGEVQFMGIIEGKQGLFYGVKLDGPDGKNDGSVGDIKYFDCFENYGIFVTTSKIIKSEPTQFNAVLPRVCIGDRIYVKDHRFYGIVQFVGTIDDKEGCWYGIELEDPMGEHNGSLGDRQYFECQDFCGIFCEAKNIESNRASKKPTKSRKSTQKSHSDIAQIKNNYNQNQNKPAVVMAPPPPMPEPETKKPPNLMEVDIETMGFIQLKARCGMEGLDTFGTKKQLLERLRQHLGESVSRIPSKPPLESPTSFDPDLHDIPIEKDDFYNPISKVDHQDAFPDQREIGSVIYNPNAAQPVQSHVQSHAQSPRSPRSPRSPVPQSHTPPVQSHKPPMNPLNASRSTPLNPSGQRNGHNPSGSPPPGPPNNASPQNLTNIPSPTSPSSAPTSPQTHNSGGHEQQAHDWIMLPDPSTGKMYYANLKTKATRWDPPPGFGVDQANLNPGYDPGIRFQHSPTDQQAQMQAPHNNMQAQPIFAYASGRNLGQFAQSQPGTNMNRYLGRQVSPFAQSSQNFNVGQQSGNSPFNQYPNYAAIAQQFQKMGTQSASNMNNYTNTNPLTNPAARIAQPGLPTTSSQINMGSTNPLTNPSIKSQHQAHPGMPNSNSASNMTSNMSNSSSNKQHKRRISTKQQPTKPLPLKKSGSSGHGSADPLAKLEASKWKKTKDPNSGREYWYHKETKQTTWDTPPAVLKVNAAENTIGSITEMAEIGKAEWEEESDSDGSSSGSYYSDGTDSEEEEEDDYKQQLQSYYAQQEGNGPYGGGGGNGQVPQPGNSGNGINYPYGAQGQPPNGWNAVNTPNNQQPPNGGPNGPNTWNPQQNGPGNGPNGAAPNFQHGMYPQQGGAYPNPQQAPPGQHGHSAQGQGQMPIHPYYQRQIPTMEKRNSARQMYLKPQSQININPQQIEEKAAEDNPWISAEEAKSRVIVRDTLKRYWQIGAEQKFKLDEWAQNNYNLTVHKKGLFSKKEQSISDLLSFCDFNKVKHPLNRKAETDEKTKTQTMQTWKNINSYMGIRKTGKAAEGHVEKLVRFALKGDDIVRNEIYCQLAKQTTKNPKLQSLLKGWKLLLICCSFFPPSDDFVDYLACFIWNNTQQPNEIGQYAIKALHALDATMLSGSRKFPPLPLEIVKLENLQPIPLNIYFINGMKCKQVLVTSQTRAKQVIETLAQTFSFVHPEAFGLYEMEPHIPPLDKMKKHYLRRELMSQQEKINDLIRMPFERELEDDDRMLDVIASWLKRDQSKKRKDNGSGSGSGSDGKSGVGSGGKKKRYKSSKNVRFVIKVKTFRKTMEKQFCSMGAKANFLTHSWHVVNDYYPLNPSDASDLELAFDLAALQLQGTFGPKPKMPATSKFDGQNQREKKVSFYSPGLIALDLHKYLGQAVLKKYLPQDRAGCEAKILQHREKFSKMQRSACWLAYAKKIRKHTHRDFHSYFGAAWYRGVRIEGGGSQEQVNSANANFAKGPKSLGQKGHSITKSDRSTNDLLVGINEQAITFVNPITQEVVERYQMEEILTFGYRSNAFLFVAGTLMTQTKMQIATMHGKAMNRLVRTHIDLRVRDAEKKGKSRSNGSKK